MVEVHGESESLNPNAVLSLLLHSLQRHWMLCLSSTNAATEMLRQTSREQASIKTFRFSDLLSATMGSSVSKKKRRNRSLYALSVLFLLAYFTVSASRTSHAHVRLIGHGTHGLNVTPQPRPPFRASVL